MTVIRDPQTLISNALAVIDEAIRLHPAQELRTLFSGGHDSTVTAWVASQHPAFAGAVHIDTTTGIPETQAFVRETCARQGWVLNILRPNITYPMLIVKSGFPGAARHNRVYQRLKEQPLDTFISKIKHERRAVIALTSGCRSQESVRRMGTTKPINRDGTHLWINPIHDWSALEVGEVMAHVGLARNPVKDLLHISGECTCGCFAEPNELRDIQLWFPQHYAEMERWHALVRQAYALHNARIPGEARWWGWGRGVPLEQPELPMCWHCRGELQAA